MIHIKGSNVTIMVKDMDVAVSFYTDILGMKLENRYGNHYAEIEGPGIRIGLHPAGKELKVGNNLQLGFSVENIKDAIEELGKHGLQLTLQEDQNVKFAPFTDPDGNMLYLAQTANYN